MNISRFVPALEWGRRYDHRMALRDGVAAVIVTIMLVPQSLGYAMLAGLAPQVGLYASILPLIAYALFGTSRSLAVGPVAVVSLMTAAAVGKLAEAGSADYLAAAIMLAALSGLMLVAMSLLRLGFIASLLSHPVISGFISASGLLIAASQLKHVLGVKAGGDSLPEILLALAGQLASINFITLALGLISIGFLIWVRKGLKPLLHRLGLTPALADLLVKAGPLAAIFLTTLAVAGLHLDGLGVKIVGAIPAGLPPFGLPGFDIAMLQALLAPALLIGLVGFVESVSVAQTLAAKRRQRIDPDQELLALGVSNIASSLSGGFPVTGGFSRSVVNFDAGAETQIAGVLAALGILIASVYLTPLFHYLPQAVLAATIIVAVLSLIDIAAMRRVWAYSRADFCAMAATVIVVLAVGVEAGILTGVTVSLLLFLWRTSRPHVAVIGLVPGTEHFRNVERHRVKTDASLLCVRVDESLYFANARHLEDQIYDLAVKRRGLKNVVLVCNAINFIDSSALESLESLHQRLRSAGIGFHLSEVKGPVMDGLRNSDFFAHFTGKVFLSQYKAWQALTRA